jgi:hypothetical protein
LPGIRCAGAASLHLAALLLRAAEGYPYRMTGRGRQSQNPGGIARAERLAAALRQNMKRRKAQARQRAQTRIPGTDASHDSARIMPEKSKD